MPKRGSPTPISSTAVPRKKQKRTQSTNGHNDEGYDENTPLNHSTYSSQLVKNCPDVNLSFFFSTINKSSLSLVA